MKPTVGRVVYYYPSGNERADGWNMPLAGEPLAAMVAGVQKNGLLHLNVLDFHGVERSRQSIPFIEDQVVFDKDEGGFAAWMPYQMEQNKAQAKLASLQAVHPKADLRHRFQALEMALRADLDRTRHHSYVKLAQEFEEFLSGQEKIND